MWLMEYSKGNNTNIIMFIFLDGGLYLMVYLDKRDKRVKEVHVDRLEKTENVDCVVMTDWKVNVVIQDDQVQLANRECLHRFL